VRARRNALLQLPPPSSFLSGQRGASGVADRLTSHPSHAAFIAAAPSSSSSLPSFHSSHPSSSSSSSSSHPSHSSTARFSTLRTLPALSSSPPFPGFFDESVMAKQDTDSTQAVLAYLKTTSNAELLVSEQLESIRRRDTEDEERIAKGIDRGISKGLLEPQAAASEPYVLNISERSVDDICQEIIHSLGDAPSRGCIVTIQGRSGTGKGTVVARLRELLPQCYVWSNGNSFRVLTLLALARAEARGTPLEDALAMQDLKEYEGMVNVVFRRDGTMDIEVDGMGYHFMVSQEQNRLLKRADVEKHLPMVAQEVQGEVLFTVNQFLTRIIEGGYNVILEGRAKTLEHIHTPHRFALELPDPRVVAERRLAQRIAAVAWHNFKAAKARGEEADLLQEVQSAVASWSGPS